MTDRELFEKALEALECPPEGRDMNELALQVMRVTAALRERLAQPIIKNYLGKDNSAQPQRTHWEGCEEVHPECRQQEPVAWISEGGDVSRSKRYMDEMGFECNPLYAAPQRREWVGLTADEIWKCNAAPKGSAVEYHICMAHQNVLDFAEAIEAKLKEKNT